MALWCRVATHESARTCAGLSCRYATRSDSPPTSQALKGLPTVARSLRDQETCLCKEGEWSLEMDFYAKVLILALIQGAAELLPVSSSAHVILAQKLMGFDPSSPSMVFLLIMLHTGTMFAAIVYFWAGWKATLFPPQGSPGAGRRFVLLIVLATAATGVLGLGLQFLIERVVLERWFGHPRGEIEQLFKSLPLIGVALLAAGLVILASSRF